MENISLKQIKQLIEIHDSIVLYRHIRPDFDASGSVFGLKEIININYPQKRVYINGENENDSYFPKVEKANNNIVKNSLAIICDTSIIDRCDDGSFSLAKEHLVIDHHIANNFPYKNRYVDEFALSTSILIAKFAQDNNLKINTNVANYLYGGIISDTQKLSIDKVDCETFKLISYLAEYNINIPAINRAVYDETIDKFKAKSYFINKIIIDNDVAYFYAKKHDLKVNNILANTVKDFVDTMNCIKGVEKWAVFAQNDDGSYTGSLRSHGPIIVNLAHQYNGGGHNLACGVNNLTYKQTKEIISKLKDIK